MPALTFVHASGFRISEPVTGISELPPPLVNRLIEAPRKTLLRVAEIACAEGAHAVLLTGDVLSPRSSTCGDWFAVLQFCERLASSNIPVIWLWGEQERHGHWPEELPFPPNVHIFRGDEAERALLPTGAGPVQVEVLPPENTLYGRKLPSQTPTSAVYTVGLSYPALSAGNRERLPEGMEVDYWACGGGIRGEFEVGGRKGHDPGPAFLNSLHEDGPPVISLVELHSPKKIFIRPVSVAALRWHTVTLHIDAQSTESQLMSQVLQEAEAKRALGDIDWLFHFRLEGSPGVLLSWRVAQFDRRLLETLRTRYGQAPPYVWPVEVAWEPSEPWPEAWMREDFFQSEFLREGERWAGEDVPSVLGEFSQECEPDELALVQNLAVSSQETWAGLVRQAVFEGLALLRECEALPPSEGGTQ